MHRVLIDCDPGIDDALALLYLAQRHKRSEIELVGVTTTAGNVGVEQTARNAAWILQLCGVSDVPVAPGLAGPVKRPLVTTPETHGDYGLGYLHANCPVPQADWKELWAQDYEQLIITGPLTNAAAYEGRLPHTTVMGGAVNYRGNTTPTAEWNFWVDPDGAKEFFAQHSARLCSLEVTEQFLIDPVRLEEILARPDNPLREQLPELLRFYFEFHQAQGEGYQAQIHDLLTCMIALDAIDYTAVQTTMDVEADSELMRGTSVADLRGHWDWPPNTELVTQADIAGAHAEFLRVLG